MPNRVLRLLFLAAAVAFAVGGSHRPSHTRENSAPASLHLKPGGCNNAQTEAPKQKTPRSLESRSYYWLT